MIKILYSILCCSITSSILLAQNASNPEATELYLNIEKVEPSKTLGMPPSDAIVLFNGAHLDEWMSPDGEPKWTIKGSDLVVTSGAGSLSSKESFSDIQMHIEWLCPRLSGKKGQAYANSGIFLMGLYEVQVLNSYENETYSNGQAGSIYKQFAPLVNASRPPEQWQTYDIIFTAPKFSEKGTLISPARITLIHNGILVQNNAALMGPTEYIGSTYYKKHAEKLPVSLQDHGDAVRFRNIWVRSL